MREKAVVVGSGSWATRVGYVLAERYNLDVRQVSARDFIVGRSEISSFERISLGVSATSPELQETVVPLLALFTEHLWLEKPISKSLQSGTKLLTDLSAEGTSYSLVNFSWLFSSIWNKFESLRLKLSDVSMIQISQSAKESKHAYISSIEDYGSHDVALINRWIVRDGNSTNVPVINRSGQYEFDADYEGIAICWKIHFESDIRKMNWLITWKDDNVTQIDFYGGKLIHNNLELEVPRQDNINSFISTLFARDEFTERENHKIALMTKECFSKI